MSSVDSLARWLVERPRNEGGSTKVLQIRVDEDTSRTLKYLAERFGMPKATLAQELLRAALKDALAATPGNRVWGDDFDDYEPPVGELYHDMSGVRDDDEESLVKDVS